MTMKLPRRVRTKAKHAEVDAGQVGHRGTMSRDVANVPCSSGGARLKRACALSSGLVGFIRPPTLDLRIL